MSILATQILSTANRLLPKPALPGDSSPADYAQWEYDTSETLIELWQRAGTNPPRALDLGCGLGGKTRRLSELSPETHWTALDLSLSHVRDADRLHREQGIGDLRKVVADVSALPFADASFDHILTADTLEHFPDPQRALREMRRCLSSDGRLILQFNPWASPRGSHLADLLYLPWCHVLFDRQILVDAALAEGDARGARSFAEELVQHFEDHVHPTTIGDLREWIRSLGCFEIESEMHVGPGPLRNSAIPSWPLCEEWLSASYGVILRPC